MRTLLTMALVLFAVPALATAEDVKGKVKSVDAEKSTITVTVGEADKTFDVSKDAKITHKVGKNEKKAKTEDLPGGLGALTAGTDVTITTEKKDDKDVVTAIKVEGLAPKKK
jgi:opacity protein-like surface antigen